MLRDRDLELLECYHEMMDRLLRRRLPELRNTDDEPLEMHRLVFDIDSPQVAFDALKGLDFDRSEEELLESAERDAAGELKRIQMDWKVPGNRVHQEWTNTVFGRIEIKGRQLIAEVNSAGRARTFKGLVEEHLGSRARFRADRIGTIEQVLSERTSRAAAEEDAELAEVPEVQAQVQELMAAHFERWVSEKIPALDGRTPLEAVRDEPEGRENVVALVIDAERMAREMRPPVEEAVLRRVRERLGL
jgi:hypothetical protein